MLQPIEVHSPVLRHRPLIPFAVHSCADAAPIASAAAAAMRPTRNIGLANDMLRTYVSYEHTTWFA